MNDKRARRYQTRRDNARGEGRCAAPAVSHDQYRVLQRASSARCSACAMAAHRFNKAKKKIIAKSAQTGGRHADISNWRMSGER